MHAYIYVENKVIKCRTKTILHTVVYDENTDSNIIVTCAFNFSMLGRVCYRSSKYPAKENYMLIANSEHFQKIDASIGRGGPFNNTLCMQIDKIKHRKLICTKSLYHEFLTLHIYIYMF